jgi:hypothetical protein
MNARLVVALLALLGGCGALGEETAGTDPPRLALEVVGIDEVEAGFRVRARLENPTESTWCLWAIHEGPQLRVELPSTDAPGWSTEDVWVCRSGTGWHWMELDPASSAETSVLVDAGIPRVRLSLWLVEGAMAPRAGYDFLWPPLDQPWTWVHSEPVDLAAVQADR